MEECVVLILYYISIHIDLQKTQSITLIFHQSVLHALIEPFAAIYGNQFSLDANDGETGNNECVKRGSCFHCYIQMQFYLINTLVLSFQIHEAYYCEIITA